MLVRLFIYAIRLSSDGYEATFMQIIQTRNPALHIVWNAGLFWKKAAATYSPAGRSTIGADGLNFSVRNGKRWSPVTIAT